MIPRLRKDDGFSLIEALLALLILSASLTILFAGLAQAWRADRLAGLRMADMQNVQARMEGFGIVEPVLEGPSTGSFADGTRWRQMVTPYSAAAGNAGGLRGFWVTIAVERTSQAGRRVEAFAMTSLKLVESPRQ